MKGAFELGEPLAAALVNPDGSEKPLYDLLTELRRYSLIRRHPEARDATTSIASCKPSFATDSTIRRSAWAERAVRAVNGATPHVEFANLARLRPPRAALGTGATRSLGIRWPSLKLRDY